MFAPAEVILMTWNEFLARTNINGASNLGSARSLFRKFVWAIILIGGLVLTIIALVAVISGYLRYEVVSTSTLEHYSKVTFPSVTICNLNRVDCSTTSEVIYACNSSAPGAAAPVNTTGLECQLSDTNLEKVISIWKMVCGADANNAEQAPEPAQPSNRRKKRHTAGSQERIVREPPTLEELGAIPEGIHEEYKFLNEYMQLSEHDRRLIGHQFENLIQECIFRERDCTEENNFMTMNTAAYGNCYIFNSAGNADDSYGGLRVSSMSGPNFGLTLVLNVEQDSYQTSGTRRAGARITVHEPTTIPLPMEFGRDLRPNSAANIAMQEVTIRRQPDPYITNCSSSWESTNYTDYVVDDWEYSLPLCQRLCLLSSFELECNCFHPLYLNSDLNRNGLEPCELETPSSVHFPCVYNIMKELDKAERNCSCNVDCHKVDFALFQSESLWPSKQYEKKAETLYGTDARAKKIQLSENLLQVNAYFASLNVQTIQETPVYESVFDGTFISALGGGLSLYLGISIAMFFEIIEFFIDLGINSFLYVVKGKRAEKK